MNGLFQMVFYKVNEIGNKILSKSIKRIRKGKKYIKQRNINMKNRANRVKLALFLSLK